MCFFAGNSDVAHCAVMQCSHYEVCPICREYLGCCCLLRLLTLVVLFLRLISRTARDEEPLNSLRDGAHPVYDLQYASSSSLFLGRDLSSSRLVEFQNSLVLLMDLVSVE